MSNNNSKLKDLVVEMKIKLESIDAKALDIENWKTQYKAYAAETNKSITALQAEDEKQRQKIDLILSQYTALNKMINELKEDITI